MSAHPGVLRYERDLSNVRPKSTYGVQLEMIPTDADVLEVGCHAGAFGSALKQHRQARVYGIDLDPAAIAIASERLDGAWVDDLTDAGWARRGRERVGSPVDVVLFGDVIEHLAEPSAALREAHDLLAPGGFIVVSVPNIAHWRVRLSLLRGRFDYTETGILDRTHLRFFTRRTLQRLLDETGYDTLTYRTSAGRVPGWAVTAAPTLLGMQHVVRAHPRDAASSGPRLTRGN